MKQIMKNDLPNQIFVPFEFSFVPPTLDSCKSNRISKAIEVDSLYRMKQRAIIIPEPPITSTVKKKSLNELIDALLDELYSENNEWGGFQEYQKRSVSLGSAYSSNSTKLDYIYDKSVFEHFGRAELLLHLRNLSQRFRHLGSKLGQCLRNRERLLQKQMILNTAVTAILAHVSGDSNIKFSVTPSGADGDFGQWLHAMRLVARLPAGVPTHFRKKLWLTLAERHLSERGVDWSKAERACFRVTQNADDTELGSQIVKDLHRTGCSLFCGTEGRENQAMLRRVLLGYARWNKDVGYCQGFNMLAAIILEVMDKSESDSLKVMIYLVEAVLPEGYFSDGLRGLSADMAAFRDLLRIRLPKLAQHMDRLQKASDGGGVEPPLSDVFTMQWFLTLYATWLPRPALLRVWDLIFVDGNEILLLTALAIWEHLQDRILATRSADEFYGCMGMAGGSGGASAVWAAGDILATRVASLGAAPELPKLRDHHRLTIAPIHSAVQSVTKKGLRLFYSEDEGESSDESNKMALATVASASRYDTSLTGSDRLSLDIGALKRQYERLRERQRQAHIILAAACARHAAVGVSTTPTSLAVNHLLLGKSAIVSSKGRRLGPPPGSIPPSRNTSRNTSITDDFEEICWQEEHKKRTLGRRNSIKWRDVRKMSLESDDGESGDGTIVSQSEADEIASRIRSRRKSSESSSYSSRSSSSSDTSLCDDKVSDGESEICSLKEDFLTINPGISNDNLNKSLEWCDTVSQTESVLGEPTTSSSTPKSTTPNFIDLKSSTPKKIFDNSPDDCKLKETYQVIPFSMPDISPTTLIESSIQVQSFSNLESKSLLSSDINMFLEKDNYDFQANELIRSSLESPTSSDNFAKNSDQLNSTYDGGELIQSLEKSFDVIDDLVRYPNFMPDISISDFNDEETPPRSPGCVSIAISDDEPPIPLKIDEYFEDSPEFFGARNIVTDGKNDENIPNRRRQNRNSRPKLFKIESQTKELSVSDNDSQSSNSEPENDEYILEKQENSEKFPQSQNLEEIEQNLSNPIEYISVYKVKDLIEIQNENLDDSHKLVEDSFSDITNLSLSESKNKSYNLEKTLETGRRNSEKALEIIQENSKILNRILTKKISSSNISDTLSSTLKTISESIIKPSATDNSENVFDDVSSSYPKFEFKSDYSSSDPQEAFKNSNVLKARPISLDESSILFKSSFDFDSIKTKCKTMTEITDNPGATHENKIHEYGWEGKIFTVNKAKTKIDPFRRDKSYSPYRNPNEYYLESKKYELGVGEYSSKSSDCSSARHSWYSKSKDDSCDYYDYTQTSKYSDKLLSKASDICSKYLDKRPKAYDESQKEDSQQSDFAHVVTSSISFTYDKSAVEESAVGVKSDSSDTLCQVASLDQISTPISPKLFPRESSSLLVDKPDNIVGSSNATTPPADDTLSSVSFPRSPSSSSFHPFPTRPTRTPKDLGIRLGMYSRESLNSPSK